MVTVGVAILDVGGGEAAEEREDAVDDISIMVVVDVVVVSCIFFSPREDDADAADAIRSFRSFSTSATTPGGIRLIISSRYSALALARFSTSLSFS